MEIGLARERIYQILPQVSLDQARSRVDEKKVSLVAGMIGSLFTRPNPAEIQLTYAEHRLEPFWHLEARLHTVYDRQRTFLVPVGGGEVKRVTLLGQSLTVDASHKAGPAISLTGVEHCEEDHRLVRTFTGDGTASADLARLVSAAKEEIPDLAEFQPEGIIVAPPAARSAAVVRQVLAEMVRPLKAQVIHEERVDMEAIDLYFRPVYAFEYTWAAKSKRMIIEVDGLSGEIKPGGKTFKEQMLSLVNRELIFDISAEAVGMVVPGGGIVVRLAKAASELKRT